MEIVHQQTIEAQCKAAAQAAPSLAILNTAIKNKAIVAMSQAILEQQQCILTANAQDLEVGKKAGLTSSLLDRLTLTPERLKGMSDSLAMIATLQDPIGEELTQWTTSHGLHIQKIRVPLGVIGMIYEARPNVTADAIGLCLKTGNGVVLRGSSTAYHSNKAIVETMTAVLETFQISKEAFQLLEDTSREGVTTFVRMNSYLNLIIPRGGASLIQNVIQTATVPTIETGVGNCHIYVHQDAQLDHAKNIIINAKTQRPSVCNAAETLLVDNAIAETFLPDTLSELSKMGVEIRGCEITRKLFPLAKAAQENDWDEEYLDLILAVKVVKNLDEALSHIATHGTLHSEAIISENPLAIQRFTQRVDAAAVLVNASTRFTDGGEFGFGAEIGISTQKLHARGPMGLAELTSYKYIVTGNGHVRK